jgi:hypothetical protein
LGQGSISGYQLLGIDPRSDPFKVLEAIRTKTQGLSQGMRRNIAAQFGISNDLVATLELTNKQFDEMAANAFVIPQGNIDSMNKARASLETVKNAANWFKAALVTQLAPSIDLIAKKFADWIRQNKDGLIKGIQTLFEWLGRVVTMVVRVAGVINQVIMATTGWENALIGIGVAFLALNASVALPVAGLLIFMAVLEDLAVYSRGGKSAFGLLVEQFPALGKVFDVAFAGIKDIMTLLKGIFTGEWGDFDAMVAKWGAFGEILKGIKDTLVFMQDSIKFENLTKSFGGLFKDIKEQGLGEAFNKQVDLFGNELSAIGNFFTPKTAAGSTTTVTVAPVITINGATDTTATKEAVKSVMDKSVGDAYVQGQSSKREVPYY